MRPKERWRERDERDEKRQRDAESVRQGPRGNFRHVGMNVGNSPVSVSVKLSHLVLAISLDVLWRQRRR
jgi:hypothetical protein